MEYEPQKNQKLEKSAWKTVVMSRRFKSDGSSKRKTSCVELTCAHLGNHRSRAQTMIAINIALARQC